LYITQYGGALESTWGFAVNRRFVKTHMDELEVLVQICYAAAVSDTVKESVYLEVFMRKP